MGDPWYAAAQATVGNLYIKGDTGSSGGGGDGDGDGDDGESFFCIGVDGVFAYEFAATLWMQLWSLYHN